MAKGRGGIEFGELVVGKGPIVGRRDRVRARVTTSLHRGEIVGGPAVLDIDLTQRDVVAGLRYGIEGMRLGGQRRVVCPPHLGYGPEPNPGIPGNALLIFEVEILEIVGVPRKQRHLKPRDPQD